MRPFYAFARMVTRLIFAVLYDVRFEGQENIPAQGGALVVCNHRFAKDPVVLSHAFPHRQIFFMSKAEWFQHKPLGLLLGAFFMATDYVTSPVSHLGQAIFGVGCGLITVFIRYFGGNNEGVCYAILMMNLTVWLIDKNIHPHRFGVAKAARTGKKQAEKKEAESK